MAAVICDPVTVPTTSPGAHIIINSNSVLILFVEVEVGAAVATVHLMVCGCSGCCSVGGVCAWYA